MDKVVLVMNDPTCCVNCPLLRTSHMPNTWICGIPHNNGNVDMVFEPVDIDSDTKPDWCPLRLVPEKYDALAAIENNPNYDPSYDIGRNDCIDDIIGN